MPSPVLEFSNVTLLFDDVVALDNVSFCVETGASLVILGVTGSGKSVLLKLSIGLLRPDAGEIYLFGEKIDDMPERDLLPFRRQAGMVFQESALFDSLTVGENVAYPIVSQEEGAPPREEVGARVREALSFVELEEAIDKLPSELSGGMRRRVAIARAIVNRPRLLLYDSPTAGLDPITAHTIMTLVLKERDTANVTSLLVTHRLQDAHLLAGFRYDPARSGLVPAQRDGAGAAGPAAPRPAAGQPQTQTRFLVLNKGKLVFQGGEEEMNRHPDPYVRKFTMKRG
ncbi:MAG TPA: ATP-binding cassette domain-containing protein [Bryobacterales bacterium]|nr:ATP-binding cassette domain-containing protein [Bryobacterales bacterium]